MARLTSRSGYRQIEARLNKFPQRVLTSVNYAHRIVLMATERGTLQQLLFNN